MRSFAARKAGWRSGSSRQKTNERVTRYARWIAQQLVGVARHPVDVLAEVRVRVEDRGAGRQLGAGEVGVERQQPFARSIASTV